VIELDDQQATARQWFEQLRDLICAEFEAIEREAGSDAAFDYLAWDRSDPWADRPGDPPSRLYSVNWQHTGLLFAGRAPLQTLSWIPPRICPTYFTGKTSEAKSSRW